MTVAVVVYSLQIFDKTYLQMQLSSFSFSSPRPSCEPTRLLHQDPNDDRLKNDLMSSSHFDVVVSQYKFHPNNFDSCHFLKINRVREVDVAWSDCVDLVRGLDGTGSVWRDPCLIGAVPCEHEGSLELVGFQEKRLRWQELGRRGQSRL